MRQNPVKFPYLVGITSISNGKFKEWGYRCESCDAN